MHKIILLAITFFIIVPLYSQPFYVDKSGSDFNNGSMTQPWKTIQKAFNSSIAGSTVYIKQGTYFEKPILNVSGILGSYITFKNYNADVVIIDGTGISGGSIINITDKNFVKLVGLNITNNIGNDAQGILVQGSCKNIEIRNNKISNIHFSSNPSDLATASTNSQPLIVFGNGALDSLDNLIIDGNEVFNSRTGYSEGLAVNGNVTNFQITNNIVYNISNIGIVMIGHEGVCSNTVLDQARNGLCRGNTTYNCISPYAAAGGIYVDGGRNILIDHNKSYGNQYGIEVGSEILGYTASGIIVKDNLLYNNKVAGIAFGGYNYPATTGRVLNCQFLNNTTYNNDITNSGSGEVMISYAQNCIVKNNIFFASSQNTFISYSASSNSTVGNQFNYNLYYSSSGPATASFDWGTTSYTGFLTFKSSTNQEANALFSDPMLLNPVLSDFHISMGSPAINAGDPNFVAGPFETDMDGKPRIDNTRVDIGAYEYSTTTGTLNAFINTSDIIYPNPNKGEFIIKISQKGNYYIRIYNNTGIEIMSTSSTQTETLIDIKNAQSGIYFIKIDSDNLSISKKIIVE